MTKSFSLVEEPWIPVLTHDGESHLLSLREVFDRAPDLSAVVGDLPTQAFAVQRLLVAILHRVVASTGDLTARRWELLWRSGRLPTDEISEYLERYAARFDLLHPAAPFYQVAGLHTKKGETRGLEVLVADVPNGHQYFTTRAGRGLAAMSLAEAARWVVHCQAFDPSGIKSGAEGDDRVKGGKGYPIGVAPCGLLGGIWVDSGSLFESLLLNLVPAAANLDRQGDTAAWEREPLTASVEHGHPLPLGPADLLTWQSRRILLVSSGGEATGVLVANGDPLPPSELYPLESMTAWRLSEVQAKRLGRAAVYMPLTHRPDRAMWRGLEALLPDRSAVSGRAADVSKPPGVLQWLARLRDDDVISASHVLRAGAVGMAYGSQSSVIDTVIDDVVVLHASVLTNPVLRSMAVDAVHAADRAVGALGNLADNLERAAGGDAGGARERAREAAYDALDEPYRRWVARLTGVEQDAGEGWQTTVRRIVEFLGAELLESAGSPAWVGRVRDDQRLDAGLAERWFRAALRKALPLASWPVREPSSSDAGLDDEALAVQVDDSAGGKE